MENRRNLKVLLLMCFWKIKIMVVLVPLIYKSFGRLLLMKSQFEVLLQSTFVPPWTILGDYTVFKNSYTRQYLFWSNLSSIRVVFSWYFTNVSQKWSEEESIFIKLKLDENIKEGFPFAITLKPDFWNDIFLQILSLVDSYFFEIRVLLPITLQKELPQVRFLGISKINSLQRCI